MQRKKTCNLILDTFDIPQVYFLQLQALPCYNLEQNKVPPKWMRHSWEDHLHNHHNGHEGLKQEVVASQHLPLLASTGEIEWLLTGADWKMETCYRCQALGQAVK